MVVSSFDAWNQSFFFIKNDAVKASVAAIRYVSVNDNNVGNIPERMDARQLAAAVIDVATPMAHP